MWRQKRIHLPEVSIWELLLAVCVRKIFMRERLANVVIHQVWLLWIFLCVLRLRV
jgi:hypothetical protein